MKYVIRARKNPPKKSSSRNSDVLYRFLQGLENTEFESLAQVEGALRAYDTFKRETNRRRIVNFLRSSRSGLVLDGRQIYLGKAKRLQVGWLEETTG